MSAQNQDGTFEKWLRLFAKYIGATTENPTLHSRQSASHSSLNAYLFCRENWIPMPSLPPQTSHRMQPLDVTYSPLKTAYYRE